MHNSSGEENVIGSHEEVRNMTTILVLIFAVLRVYDLTGKWNYLFAHDSTFSFLLLVQDDKVYL